MFNIQKRGYFRFTRKFLEDSPRTVQKIMAKVIILRAEYLFTGDIFEYTAISHLFRKLEPGEETPRYQINCITKNNGFVHWKFEEVKG